VKKKIFLPQSIALILLVLSCNKSTALEKIELLNKDSGAEELTVYHTWLSRKEMVYGDPHHPPVMETLPQGYFPWAGIVSHHLLAHDYLDAWFSRLAELRQPRCFYILSPSHYGISLEAYSLTIGSWDSGSGLVESDINKTLQLAELLDVGLDMGVFQIEHGVSVFMPYIKKYFPDAVVVAIAYEGEGPVNIPKSRLLADALESEFDDEGKRDNFLLISTDFSHQNNLEETYRRDNNSQRYLKKPGDATGGISWNFVVCDNRPAIYVLDRLGKNNLESYILYHTNSWEISGKWEDDVTSYFFVYFAEKGLNKGLTNGK
jgi:AmmeMemoRadiSam system protein B